MTNYKIPETFMGHNCKEEYERVMRGERDKPKVQTPVVQQTGKDLADFIYVPSINLYVAKHRTHLGKDWFDCHKLLQQNNERMLIVPEFIEFLKYCKVNHLEIYKDITKVRKPLRGEWLDADFKVIKNKLHINYAHVLEPNGNLIPKNSKLLDSNTLMKGKHLPGISLEDWLKKNHTKQGLPNKNIKLGNLYYSHPQRDDNSVVGFVADSSWADLSYGRDPYFKSFSLGVRVVKEKN